MATCNLDTPVHAMVFIFIATAFIGYNGVLNSSVATICIDGQREIGTATGIAGSARSFISTICAALVSVSSISNSARLIILCSVYTVVLSNRLTQTIPAKVPPALISAVIPATSITSFLTAITAITAGTPAAWAAVEGLTPSIQAAGVRPYKDASSSAYSTVYLTTIAFSGI